MLILAVFLRISTVLLFGSIAMGVIVAIILTVIYFNIRRGKGS